MKKGRKSLRWVGKKRWAICGDLRSIMREGTGSVGVCEYFFRERKTQGGRCRPSIGGICLKRTRRNPGLFVGEERGDD